jgi:hypothetical protein
VLQFRGAELRNAGCGLGGGEGRLDVGGQDAATGTGSSNGREVHSAIESELADGRRGLRPSAAGRCGSGRGGRWSPPACRGGAPCPLAGSAVVEDNQDLTNLDDVACAEGQRDDLSGHRRREFDQRLVGLDLDEGLVPADGVPRRDQPGDDLSLFEALADIGKLELDPCH